uniref:Uncharacterized protein n=1 Tax=Zea mays TaxID=4577 RepID=B6UCV0_MAIZE|nr:hypothetical protein [Zea mays]
MGSPGSANGRRGDYVRIPEEAEVASKGEGDAAAAVKAAAAAECPRVLRCSAIRWWAKVAVLLACVYTGDWFDLARLLLLLCCTTMDVCSKVTYDGVVMD